MTFNGDQNFTGYGITTRSYAVFTLSGTWTLNASGRVVGTYTEDLDGQQASGSFIGKARAGRNFQADVLAQNGIFKLSGKPPGFIPNFSGSWVGLVTEARNTVVEHYQITASEDFPGVFDIVGNGAGPSGAFTVAGAAILTWKGGATAFAISEFQGGGIAAAYVIGKYNAAMQTASLTGFDSNGLQLRIKLSRN